MQQKEVKDKEYFQIGAVVDKILIGMNATINNKKHLLEKVLFIQKQLLVN